MNNKSVKNIFTSNVHKKECLNYKRNKKFCKKSKKKAYVLIDAKFQCLIGFLSVTVTRKESE